MTERLNDQERKVWQERREQAWKRYWKVWKEGKLDAYLEDYIFKIGLYRVIDNQHNEAEEKRQVIMGAEISISVPTKKKTTKIEKVKKVIQKLDLSKETEEQILKLLES